MRAKTHSEPAREPSSSSESNYRFDLPELPPLNEFLAGIDDYAELRSKPGSSQARRILEALDQESPRIVQTVVDGVFQTARAKRALEDIVQQRLDPSILNVHTPELSEGLDTGPRGKIRKAFDIHLRSEVNQVADREGMNSKPERLQRTFGLLSERKVRDKAASRMEKLQPKVTQLSREINSAAVPMFWQGYTDALIKHIETETDRLSQLGDRQHNPNSWSWDEPKSFPLTILSNATEVISNSSQRTMKRVLGEVPGLAEAVAAAPEEPLYRHLVEALSATPRYDIEPLPPSDTELRALSTPNDVLDYPKNQPFHIMTGPNEMTRVDAVDWSEKNIREEGGHVIVTQNALTEVKSAVGDIERLPPDVLSKIGPARRARLAAARDQYEAAYQGATATLLPDDIVARNELHLTVKDLYDTAQVLDGETDYSSKLDQLLSLRGTMMRRSNSQDIERVLAKPEQKLNEAWQLLTRFYELSDTDPEQTKHLPILTTLISAHEKALDDARPVLRQALDLQDRLIDLSTQLKGRTHKSLTPPTAQEFKALNAQDRLNLSQARDIVLTDLLDIKTTSDAARAEITTILENPNTIPLAEQAERFRAADDILLAQDKKLALIEPFFKAVPKLEEAVREATEGVLQSAAYKASHDNVSIPSDGGALVELRKTNHEFLEGSRAPLNKTAAFHFTRTTPLKDPVSTHDAAFESFLAGDKLVHGGTVDELMPERQIFNVPDRELKNAVKGSIRLAAHLQARAESPNAELLPPEGLAQLKADGAALSSYEAIPLTRHVALIEDVLREKSKEAVEVMAELEQLVKKGPKSTIPVTAMRLEGMRPFFAGVDEIVQAVPRLKTALAALPRDDTKLDGTQMRKLGGRMDKLLAKAERQWKQSPWRK